MIFFIQFAKGEIMRKQKQKVLKQELRTICQELQNKLNTMQDYEGRKKSDSPERNS
jgi:hypothetical protein